MGVLGENKLKHLHKLLEKHVLAIKKRKMLENNQDPTSMGTKELWRIPFKIVAFI